jgi:hypothetical protein
MKNRLLLSALLAVALTALVWLNLHRSERDPLFQGRQLSDWLTDFDHWDGANTNTPFVMAVRALGTNAIPMLVTMSLWRDSSLKERIGIEFEKHPKLMHYRYTMAARRWQRAGQALSVIGEAARTAVPYYLRALSKGDILTRRCALNALGSIGPQAEDSLPTLLALQNDQDLRPNLMGTLGDIGRRADICVPLLVQALQDTNVDVRRSAAYGLGGFGGRATAALSDLTRALRDKHTARLAAGAIKKIQPESEAVPGPSLPR